MIKTMIFFDEIKSNAVEFADKVQTISSRLGINPEWLMAVMYFESGLNHKAKNKASGAVGLIQFMPSTLKNMGLTADYITSITNVEQLDYVYQYLAPYKGKMRSLVDVYFAVFFPSAMGKDSDYILQSSGLSAEKIASQNSAFDINKDRRITKGEVENYLLNWLNRRGVESYHVDSLLVVCALLAVGFTLYSYLK